MTTPFKHENVIKLAGVLGVAPELRITANGNYRAAYANTRASGQSGQSALHTAAWNGDLAMAKLREFGDQIEVLTPHEIWPLPTYREMLFVK